ncbi:MAG TPA: flagellar biosynthesis protein FliQ [Sediminispirochaeta sp.]|nr:flagellar biosynthesis protein FliQ [Sediminispirochaeta sp.]
MSIGTAANIVQTGVLQVLIISAPVLIIGVTVGLIISIFQATTSIQEQTLTFVPKIAAILASIAFFGPWMLASMKQYTLNLLNMISQIGG